MQSSPRILVVEDDRYDNDRYCQLLESSGYDVQSVASAQEALGLVERQSFDVVLLDMLLPMRVQGRLDFGGIEVLERIKQQDATTQVIAVTGYGSRELAAEAMAAGAFDFITKDPDTDSRLPGSVRIAIARVQLLRSAQQTINTGGDELALAAPSHLVADSAAMRLMLRRAQQLADIDSSVLIMGESGVGKDLVANIIHINSRYAAGPFTLALCRSFSANLVELWGDASQAGSGLCVASEGGTLVLQGIERLPFNQQKQLVDLAERKIYRSLGGQQTLNCHLRIIATTTVDLRQWVHQGRFWRGLYDALSVAILEVPPLRERRDKDDILALAGYLLRRYGLAESIAPSAATLLAAYDYARGNINELEEILRDAGLEAEGGIIQPIHLKVPVVPFDPKPPAPPLPAQRSDHTDQITALSSQIAAKRKRLDQRKLQAARYGFSVDPIILEEIEELNHEIASMEQQLQNLERP